MKRAPKIGDAVAYWDRHRTFSYGYVFEIENSGSLVLRFTLEQTAGNDQVRPIEKRFVAAPNRVWGEWQGHADEGPICWCRPTIERHGAMDIVVHNQEAGA